MKKFLLIFAIILLQSTAFGLTLNNARVVYEKDDDDAIRCQIDEKLNIASVESALRYNRISINEKSDVNFYMRNNVLRLSSGTCVTSLQLEVMYFQYVLSPESTGGTVIRTIVSLCEKSVLLSGGESNMRKRVSDEYKGLTEICISQISKL